MSNAIKSPAAAPNAADRANKIVDLDRTDIRKSKPPKGESLAVVIIAKRHGVTITHARIICQLAGIGARYE